MELNRCSRCGNFYYSNGNVCPKCSTKDGAEFGTFKNYIQENGLGYSLNSISSETGISVNNLNRFLGYPEFQDLKKELGNLNNNNNIEIENNNILGNNGIIFNG